jgi:hypothetical protein
MLTENIVLVSRVREVYDPFVSLFGGSRDDSGNADRERRLEFVLRYPPEEEYVEEADRSYPHPWQSRLMRERHQYAWHWGRIRYFYEMLRSGEALDPIVLDNKCANGHVYPILVLVDGHHRLCAADLAEAQTIPVLYSGRVDLLKWLEGKRAKRPEE